jgi:hypothetical protein
MAGETALELVEQHIRESEAHIARQKEVIEELRRDGEPTEAAESLLRIFEETLAAQQRRADQLRLQPRSRT